VCWCVSFVCCRCAESTAQLITWLNRVVSLLELETGVEASPTAKPSAPLYSYHHADLLALVCLLLPRLLPPHETADLHERLLNLCLEIVRDVAALSRVAPVESQVFIQAMNVLGSIWSNFDSLHLATLLVNSGILNNLLVVFNECSTKFDGAEFCQAIVRLLLRVLLPPTAAPGTSDLSQSSGEGVESSRECLPRALAELVASYADVLIRGLRLPPTDKLMVWLAQEEACESAEAASSEGAANGPWHELVLSELRLISLLCAQLGGACEAGPLGSLLSSFLLENHDQLSALLALPSSTTSAAATAAAAVNDVGSARPSMALLLIAAVLDLYWFAMHSSTAATSLISCKCVASVTLFADGRPSCRVDRLLPPMGASIDLPADVWTSVFNAIVQLTQHYTTILLLRPGFPDLPSSTTTTTSTTSTKQGTANSVETRPFKGESRASLDLNLLPVIKLLNSCLRLLIVQTPSLGDLSFASASEIAAMTPVTVLNFAPPSVESSNALTFGTLFSIARSTSQLIVNHHQFRPAATDPCASRRAEFLSLLVELNELAFSLIYAQATIWLMNPRIDPSDKHTVSWGLAVEFQSYNFLGRSSRRSMRVRGRRSSLSSGKMSAVETPVKNPLPLSKLVRDSPLAGETADTSGQLLADQLSFLAFTERFSDLIK
uniref:Protein MON2 homolog n=1 Tax=Mesocestoides corti TaxID=53468 RepID=A0A5K3ESL3_MESCO